MKERTSLAYWHGDSINAVPEDFLRRDLKIDKCKEKGVFYRGLSMLYQFGNDVDKCNRYVDGWWDRFKRKGSK